MPQLQLGVLCSGGGTNLQAILDACAAGAAGPADAAQTAHAADARPALDARVRLVVCNKAGAGALERAARAGVSSRVIPHGNYASREAYDEALVEALRAAGVEMVVLAGFMRIITPVLLSAFPDRVLNIHPALLPAFPGVDGPGQALAYGVAVAGCTVHLVDAGTDTGPVVAQAAVPVLEGDTRDALAARILVQEHRLLVEALSWFAAGRVEVVRGGPGERVRVRVTGHERAVLAPAT
jgi:phosphoribosylglycinamide formyltransferase 1